MDPVKLQEAKRKNWR